MQALISIQGEGSVEVTLHNKDTDEVTYNAVMTSETEPTAFDFTEPVVLTMKEVKDGDTPS